MEYALRPRTWDYYFSFRVSDPKCRWDPGPYSQLATLSLKGDLIRPIDTRFKHIKVTLSARQKMMSESQETASRTIGSLSSSEDALYTYVFIPAEFVPELASVAQSGRICVIRLLGTRLRYRSASLVGLSLTTDDEEDENTDEKSKAEAA